MTTVAETTSPYLRLDRVSWKFYEALLQELQERPVFVTFDEGSIELMSPSFKHDVRGRCLGLIVNIVAEELNIRLQGAGSTTFKREDLEAGLEPDECFYIANVARVRGRTEIDLTVDPPPDLAIEVEVSRRMIARMPIYAKLGVPEIWRDDGTHVHVHLLSANREYQEASQSISFPMLPLDQVNRFLDLASTMDEMTWTRTVRQWVKENLVGKS